MRQQLRQIRLTAEPPGCFEQGNVMADFSRNRRGFHTGGTTADDRDGTWIVGGWPRAEKKLASALRILNAGYREAELGMADTRLIATDACSNIFRTAGSRLARHLRVANHCACHPAHVRSSLRDDLFGLLRLIDTAGDED